MEKLPKFLEGEKVIIETKPSSFIAYFLSQPLSFTILTFVLLIILFLGFMVWSFRIIAPILPHTLTEIFVMSLSPFLFLIVGLFLLHLLIYVLKYRWEYYWITNLRIIQRKGLIGYHFYSTPYERMSDIIVSRSWIERILGVGSVRVQTLAGSISFEGRFGAELRMVALANPEEVQKIAWQFLRRKLTRV